jgi:hypothetical protein
MTAAAHDDGHVVDVIRARKIEILDGDGAERICLGANANGAAFIEVLHPSNEDFNVVLMAGLDTEVNNVGRAGIYIHDGRDSPQLDAVRDRADRAYIAELEGRLRQLEERLDRMCRTLAFISAVERDQYQELIADPLDRHASS